MKLNDKQLRAVEVENKNVLVSAAAGSGKTRVLVERIVSQLLNNKLRIEDLLAMTFTRDAAAEMKNRIKDRLLKAVDENENKSHILSQLYLLQNANISTIDSFCKRLVDENFSKIDNLDPNYRIADEKEINLIISDSINTLLNNIYEEIYDNKYYKSFIKCYFNKNDSQLREIFSSGLNFLNSKIYPMDYMKNIIDEYDNNNEDYYNNILIPEFIKYIKDAKFRYAELDVEAVYEEIKNDAEEKHKYVINTLRELNNKMDDILNIDNLLDMSYDELKFVNAGLNARTKNILKPLIYFYKEVYGEISKFYNYIYIFKKTKDVGYNSDKIYDELLLKLYEIYEDNKKEKNIIEISDLQKYAIRLLMDKDGNFTDMAKKLQKKYKQIYIDEYQDTNDVQETLIRALSDDFNNNNVFMVGDVKQSIYGFRNSKPDLFNEKFKTYTENQDDNNKKELIMLNTNYRCDKNIIDFTNNVFNRIMTKSYSDIDYTLAKLNYGKGDIDKNAGDNKFEKLNKKIEVNVLLKKSSEEEVVDKKNKKNKQDDNSEPSEGLEFNMKKDYSKSVNDNLTMEDEARFIADRIRQLHDNDGIEYRDIVILSRSTKTMSDIYIKEFAKFDIPIVAELKSGFYISYEIRFMLNLLTVIDNPMDDIALSSVLTSKLYKVNNNELAFLKLLYKNDPYNFNNKYFSLYDIVSRCDIERIKEKNENNVEKCKKTGNTPYIVEDIYSIIDKIKKYNNGLENDKKVKYLENIDDYDINIDELVSKIKIFLSDVKLFRYYSRYKSISELINIIYNKTYIYNYAASLLNGKVRTGNLDLLFDIAKNYENTSYVGLYNFIRFIEKMREREEDEGMAQVFSKNENVVRMMTIHKSKGLEFPVVIMPYMNRGYNKSRSIKNIIAFDNQHGPVLNFIDYEKRIQMSTGIKEKIINKIIRDEKKEEQRLMYVAFTRAREKLIFSYICNDQSKLDEKLFDEKEPSAIYDDNTIDNIKNYNCFLKAAMSTDKENIKNHNSYIDYREITEIPEFNDVEKNINQYNNVFDDISENIDNNKNIDLFHNDTVNAFDYDVEKNIKTNYEFEYLTELTSKFSVSQIKHLDYNYYTKYKKVLENSEINYNLKYILNNKIENDVDTFNTDLEDNDERMDGSQLGTIYHKFMQNFDFQNLNNVPKQIDKSHIEKFLNTDIAKELRTAYCQKNKSLFTEQRFMKMFKYTDILNYKKDVNFENDNVLKEIDNQLDIINGHIDPNVVVQGVIDVFYIKINSDGNRVINIIDYKTDGLLNNKIITEDVLKSNYSVQLILYKKAVEELTKINVDKCYIYSFSLGKFIEI